MADNGNSEESPLDDSQELLPDLPKDTSRSHSVGRREGTNKTGRQRKKEDVPASFLVDPVITDPSQAPPTADTLESGVTSNESDKQEEDGPRTGKVFKKRDLVIIRRTRANAKLFDVNGEELDPDADFTPLVSAFSVTKTKTPKRKRARPSRLEPRMKKTEKTVEYNVERILRVELRRGHLMVECTYNEAGVIGKHEDKAETFPPILIEYYYYLLLFNNPNHPIDKKIREAVQSKLKFDIESYRDVRERERDRDKPVAYAEFFALAEEKEELAKLAESTGEMEGEDADSPVPSVSGNGEEEEEEGSGDLDHDQISNGRDCLEYDDIEDQVSTGFPLNDDENEGSTEEFPTMRLPDESAGASQPDAVNDPERAIQVPGESGVARVHSWIVTPGETEEEEDVRELSNAMREEEQSDPSDASDKEENRVGEGEKEKVPHEHSLEVIEALLTGVFGQTEPGYFSEPAERLRMQLRPILKNAKAEVLELVNKTLMSRSSHTPPIPTDGVSASLSHSASSFNELTPSPTAIRQEGMISVSASLSARHSKRRRHVSSPRSPLHFSPSSSVNHSVASIEDTADNRSDDESENSGKRPRDDIVHEFADNGDRQALLDIKDLNECKTQGTRMAHSRNLVPSNLSRRMHRRTTHSMFPSVRSMEQPTSNVHRFVRKRRHELADSNEQKLRDTGLGLDSMSSDSVSLMSVEEQVQWAIEDAAASQVKKKRLHLMEEHKFEPFAYTHTDKIWTAPSSHQKRRFLPLSHVSSVASNTTSSMSTSFRAHLTGSSTASSSIESGRYLEPKYYEIDNCEEENTEEEKKRKKIRAAKESNENEKERRKEMERRKREEYLRTVNHTSAFQLHLVNDPYNPTPPLRTSSSINPSVIIQMGKGSSVEDNRCEDERQSSSSERDLLSNMPQPYDAQIDSSRSPPLLHEDTESSLAGDSAYSAFSRDESPADTQLSDLMEAEEELSHEDSPSNVSDNESPSEIVELSLAERRDRRSTVPKGAYAPKEDVDYRAVIKAFKDDLKRRKTNLCCGFKRRATRNRHLVKEAPSLVLNGGNGIIVTKDICPGTILTDYDGIFGSLKELRKINPNESHYMELGGIGWDGHPDVVWKVEGRKLVGLASMANHSRKEYNCIMIDIHAKCERCKPIQFFLVAKFKLKLGTELFWNYGKVYRKDIECDLCRKDRLRSEKTKKKHTPCIKCIPYLFLDDSRK